MKKKNHFDYIICGGGASGLLLAFRICNDPFFINKSILLIEKEHKNSNDRTWCFWESNEGDLQQIIHKTWNQSFFASKDFRLDFNLNPYQYKMIRSLDFYQFMQKRLKTFSQLTQVIDEVKKIESNRVTTLEKEYNSDF